MSVWGGFGSSQTDYEKITVIGSGAFSTVVSATSLKNGAKVAIKMIDKRKIKERCMAARVVAEVNIHSKLRHPSILRLHNYFEDKQCVYLVSELCLTDLDTYMKKVVGQPLSESIVATMAQSIVEGLIYLHSHGIMHRDLKPSNILLLPSHKAVIGDFGLAVQLNNPEAGQKTMCGTPNFVSPEVIAREPYGLAVDLWSLGCLLVALLTGSSPFDSGAPEVTMDKVSRGKYALPASLSPEARNLITHLLQRDPEHRLSIHSVLDHPFFQKHMLAQQQPLPLPLSRQTSAHQNPPPQIPAYSAQRTASSGHRAPHSSHQMTTEDFPVRPREASAPSPNQSLTAFSLDISSAPFPHSLSPPFHSTPSHDQDYRDFSRQADPPAQPSAPAMPPMTQPSSRQASQSQSLSGPPPKLARQYSIDCAQTLQHSVYETADSLTPFSTASLPPMRQQTSRGYLEILANGSVTLNLDDEKHTMNCGPNGGSIYFCRKSATGEATGEVRKAYAFAELPEKYHRKYRHIAKFVDAVRSSAPRMREISLENTDLTAEENQLSASQLHPSSVPLCPQIVLGPSSHANKSNDSGLGPSPATSTSSGLSREHGKEISEKNSRSTRSDNQSADASGERGKYAFLNAVGWCFKTEGGDYQILFTDGARLLIESKANVVSFSDASSAEAEVRYQINKQLPKQIRTRLASFPDFMMLLKKSPA